MEIFFFKISLKFNKPTINEKNSLENLRIQMFDYQYLFVWTLDEFLKFEDPK